MTMTMILMNLAAILLVYEIKIQQHVHYIWIYESWNKKDTLPC
jgi:hypothetical protein